VLLDADVRAGIAPSSALLHALQSISPEFLPQTQTACVTGIDIAQALKREATANGQTATTNTQKTTTNTQSAWSLLSACWAVSDKYGASLSSMLQEVIGVCRRNHRATQQLKAQLAAPVAGAKLLAGLPALGLGLGFLLGANPIVWLLGNPIGWVVAAVAIAFEVAGVFWVRRIMRGATNPKRFSEIDAAATACQLIAALLKSGVTLLIAIEVAAKAISGPTSQRLSLVANRLRLGADPALAWGELTEDENLRLLAKVLIRSSQTGAPVHQSLVSVVEAARDQLASALEARARSAGVHAVAPLALCFLPAFMLVTVVPIVGSLLPTVLQLPSG
jgi:Flp pilus assembly protein TadB